MGKENQDVFNLIESIEDDINALQELAQETTDLILKHSFKKAKHNLKTIEKMLITTTKKLEDEQLQQAVPLSKVAYVRERLEELTQQARDYKSLIKAISRRK